MTFICSSIPLPELPLSFLKGTRKKRKGREREGW
jgi:hypothetical protein